MAAVDFGKRWPKLDGASPELVAALADRTASHLESRPLGQVLPGVLSISALLWHQWNGLGHRRPIAGTQLTVGASALLWGETTAAIAIPVL